MPLHTMQTLTQRQRCETGPSASGSIHRQNEMWSRFHGADKQPGTSDGRRAAECIHYQIFIDAFHDSFARYANLQGHADGDGGASDADTEAKRAAAAKARAHMGAATVSAAQALLALALLDKTPLKKRHVAALGVAVSLANCASLAPSRKSKTA